MFRSGTAEGINYIAIQGKSSKVMPFSSNGSPSASAGPC